MKKLVRTNLTNSPTRRGTENLNIQFYSHDRNNAGFEFVIKNETDLTQYTAKVLFNFTDSASTWEANGTVEGNVVKVSFNTDLIARCEEVLGYLFLDSDSDSLDIFKFKFNVVLSEIDKGEVANRQIKHVNNIGDLELVTKSQLKDELSKLQINVVDLSDYLTTKVANETYALKNEIPSINGLVTEEQLRTANNGVLEEVKKLGYAKTTEVPAAYNDSELSKRVTNLENKVDKDTVYDDSDLKSRVQALENRPTTTITSYDDSEVKRRLTDLEARPAGTSYNDKPLSDRVKVLEDTPKVDATEYNSFKESTATNVLSVRDRLGRLEKSILSNNNSLSSQTLALTNNILSISGGNSVELPVNKSEMRGTGMPNGVVEAPIGTTYIDTAKTNGALKWIKTTDGGNTGWKVAEGDTGWVLGWQNDKGNRMYFRRKNDVVHVKFEPKISDSWLNHECNLILDMGGSDISHNLSIQGFQPLDNIVQTIFKRPIDIPGVTSGAENSEGSQGMGAVILHCLYNSDDLKTGLELLIATSSLSGEENHVNPFSYLTEDEWPVQLP